MLLCLPRRGLHLPLPQQPAETRPTLFRHRPPTFADLRHGSPTRQNGILHQKYAPWRAAAMPAARAGPDELVPGGR